jgi:H+-transporting ATPase
VKLSLGGVVAADVKLVEGSILLDQSMLTGESVPIEAGPGLQTYAGALVRRGEATAIVTAPGRSTKFGHTAELVRTAHVESTQQKTVVRVVRNLAIFNGVIIVLLVAYAHARKMPIGEIIPLVLTAFWRPSRWRCPPRLRLQRRWAQRPWHDWVCFQRDCPLWTRRQRWTFFARTKRGH